MRAEKPNVADIKEEGLAEPRAWGDDKEMPKAEARWLAREVNRTLRRLLGPEWGRINVRYATHPGHEHVKITRPEDIDRALEIVTALRRILAAARHRWQILLIFDSTARYEVEMEDLEDAAEDDDDLASPYDDEEAFDPESKRQDWEYQQEKKRERREFLERQYRFRLRQEQGLEVDPQEFAPRLEEPEERATAGDVTGPEHEFDLGTDLHLYTTLTETSAFIGEHDRGLAEMLFEMKAEEAEPAAE